MKEYYKKFQNHKHYTNKIVFLFSNINSTTKNKTILTNIIDGILFLESLIIKVSSESILLRLILL